MDYTIAEIKVYSRLQSEKRLIVPQIKTYFNGRHDLTTNCMEKLMATGIAKVIDFQTYEWTGKYLEE